MRVFPTIWLLLTFAASASAQAQNPPTAEQVERFYHPLDVQVTERCIAYWQSGFGPILKARLNTALERGADKRRTVKALLQEYDDVARAMCSDIKAALVAEPQVLAGLFRLGRGFTEGAPPGTLDTDEARRWSRDNAAFTVATSHLTALYYLTFQLGREFMASPLDTEGVLDGDMLRKIDMESKRCGSGDERKMLFGIAGNKGFASMLPARYDLAALVREESRVRNECVRMGLAYTLDKRASDTSGGTDDQIGASLYNRVTAIYEKYQQQMLERGRQGRIGLVTP